MSTQNSYDEEPLPGDLVWRSNRLPIEAFSVFKKELPCDETGSGSDELPSDESGSRSDDDDQEDETPAERLQSSELDGVFAQQMDNNRHTAVSRLQLPFQTPEAAIPPQNLVWQGQRCER